MWCGSIIVFGISTVAHILILAGVAITVGTFKIAEKRPTFFLRKDGYHSTSRSRQNMWVNGKKIKLDPNDVGGEHE
tara:strand:+ start:247 stop:474 length:228 start_codon:yes stop_codon:yes gene_type:complete